MQRTYDLNPSDEALYQRSNEYLSRLNALDPYSREYSDVYNDYLNTIDQISNRDFKASLGSTVTKFAPLVRPQVQRAQVQPQIPSSANTPDLTNNILRIYAHAGNNHPSFVLSPMTTAAMLKRLESGLLPPQANTAPSDDSSNTNSSSLSSSSNSEEQQIDADRVLYEQYLTKAADYNNVRLSDLNAEASAITAGARNYLDDARGILLRATANDFGSAFESTLPEALMAAYAYARDVGATGQYRVGSNTTDSEEIADWDNLVASPREEQLKAFFDKYGGVRGFTSDSEDTLENTTDSEIATIRHDYELYTEKLLPTLRKAFNISDDAKARSIAGYIALQLLHKGTERNTALWGLFQDPYDYHSAATEEAYEKLNRALKDPGILATLNKMVKTNTALNKFKRANQAYNNAVTARNNREAKLTSLYGNERSLLQEAVSNDINKGVESNIYAREGLADSLKTLNSVLNDRQG